MPATAASRRLTDVGRCEETDEDGDDRGFGYHKRNVWETAR